MRVRQLFMAFLIASAPIAAVAQQCLDDDNDGCIAAVPEPATLALLGMGVAALVVSRAKKRK